MTDVFGPLGAVNVVDFTHGVAGPYATMILADLGADVVKIEKPRRGDPTRYMNVSSSFATKIPDVGGDYFLAINRNKRGITIDLEKPRGRDLALALSRRADVIVQSFRPGVMERLGLGSAAVREVNPNVIYASLSAYGNAGPLAGQPGMDVAVQARSGVMSITGESDGNGRPIKPGVSLADFAGGVHLAVAILGALIGRSQAGRGQDVSVSLLDATMVMLANYSVAVLDGGAEIGPMGSGHPQLVPYQAFATRDGFVVIATGTNRLYRDLCAAIGLPELADDARFSSNEKRVANRRLLIPLIEEKTRSRTTAEWITALEAASIPCAPVNSLVEAFSDEQLLANGMVQQVVHPALGPIHQLGIPYQFGGQSFRLRRPPPLLGEHTEEVLQEKLGLSSSEISELIEAEVV